MQKYTHPWQKYGWQYYVLEELNPNALSQPQKASSPNYVQELQSTTNQDAHDERRNQYSTEPEGEQRPRAPRTPSDMTPDDELTMALDDVPYPAAE